MFLYFNVTGKLIEKFNLLISAQSTVQQSHLNEGFPEEYDERFEENCDKGTSTTLGTLRYSDYGLLLDVRVQALVDWGDYAKKASKSDSTLTLRL